MLTFSARYGKGCNKCHKKSNKVFILAAAGAHSARRYRLGRLTYSRLLHLGAFWRWLAASIFLGDEPPVLQGGLVVVSMFVRAPGQFDQRTRNPLVGDQRQNVRDAVEACPPLVVGAYDMPGRILGVGRIEHPVACAGIIVPATIQLDVHRAKLPLPQRVFDP